MSLRDDSAIFSFPCQAAVTCADAFKHYERLAVKNKMNGSCHHFYFEGEILHFIINGRGFQKKIWNYIFPIVIFVVMTFTSVLVAQIGLF